MNVFCKRSSGVLLQKCQNHFIWTVSLNFLNAVQQNQCSLGSEVLGAGVFCCCSALVLFVFVFVFVYVFVFVFPVLLFCFGLFSHCISWYFAVPVKVFRWPWQSLAYVKIWTILAPGSVKNAEAHTLTQALIGFSPRELELIPVSRIPASVQLSQQHKRQNTQNEFTEKTRQEAQGTVAGFRTNLISKLWP